MRNKKQDNLSLELIESNLTPEKTIEVFEWKDLKVNIVDINNVVVGYDLGSQCCESFAWTFAEDEDVIPATDCDIEGYNHEVKFKEDHRAPEGYIFDTEIDKNILPVEVDGVASENERGLGIAFRLIPAIHSSENKVKWLVLANDHNGYYAHGYEFGKIDKVQGKVIIEGIGYI